MTTVKEGRPTLLSIGAFPQIVLRWHKEIVVVIGVKSEGQANLFQIADARNGSSLFFSPRKSGHQESSKN